MRPRTRIVTMINNTATVITVVSSGYFMNGIDKSRIRRRGEILVRFPLRNYFIGKLIERNKSWSGMWIQRGDKISLSSVVLPLSLLLSAGLRHEDSAGGFIEIRIFW